MLSEARFARVAGAMVTWAACSVAGAQTDPEEPLVARAGQHASPASGGGIQLTAGNDGSAVSLKVVGKTRSSWSGGNNGGPPTQLLAQSYELTLGAPLGKGAKRGNLVGRDGLGADGSVSLAYKWLWTEPLVVQCPGLAEALEKKAVQVQARLTSLLALEGDVGEVQRRLGSTPTEARGQLDALRKRLSGGSPAGLEREEREEFLSLLAEPEWLGHALRWLQAAYAKSAIDLGKLRAPLEAKACSEALMKANKLEAKLQYVHGANRPGLPATYFAGLALSAGMADSRFIDTATVTEVKRRDEVGSVGLFVAGVPAGSGLWFWALRADRKLTIEDRDEGVRCPGGASPQTCLSGPLGAPPRGYKTTAKAEIRRLIQFEKHRYAVAISVDRDFTAGKYGWAVPIYLVADTKGQLIGGFEIGQKEGKPKTYSLFVGVPFSLDP
jgi:hypothetical protein